MLTTAAQQNKSANKKRYNILIPFEAIMKEISAINIISIFDSFKKSPLKLKIFLPSTTIKLEIALIIVSILLIVREMPKKIIIGTKKLFFSVSINVKKAKSGFISVFSEIATNPVNPNINTIGIIIKDEKSKLFFNILKLLAA